MEYLTLLLRIIHIFAGIFWVGAAWFFFFFVEPTSHALGPDGGKFVGYMVNVRRFPVYVTVAAILTVLAGWTLWFMRYSIPGLRTGPGLVFAIGGIFGLIALGIGGAINGPTAAKLTKLGGEIASAGKPPTQEQLAQVAALQARLHTASLWTAIVTALAVLMMATARYI
jgi:uncharacterized membrane protein